MLNTKIYKLFYKILGINIIVVENLFSMNLMKYNKIHYENIVNFIQIYSICEGFFGFVLQCRDYVHFN